MAKHKRNLASPMRSRVTMIESVLMGSYLMNLWTACLQKNRETISMTWFWL